MSEKKYTLADYVKGRMPKKEYDKICKEADKLQQENLGRIADWSPDYEYDIKSNALPEKFETSYDEETQTLTLKSKGKLWPEEKRIADKAVKLIIKDYGEVIKQLDEYEMLEAELEK